MTGSPFPMAAAHRSTWDQKRFVRKGQDTSRALLLSVPVSILLWTTILILLLR